MAAHLLGVVVDQLAIDEAVWLARKNLPDFILHLLLLRLLNFRDLRSRFNAHATAKDLAAQQATWH